VIIYAIFIVVGLAHGIFCAVNWHTAGHGIAESAIIGHLIFLVTVNFCFSGYALLKKQD